MAYTLKGKNIIDEEGKDLGDISKFIDSEYGLVDDCAYELLKDVDYFSRSEKRKIEDEVEKQIEGYFTSLFEKNNEIDEADLDKEVDTWVKAFQAHASKLKEISSNYIDSILKPKTAIENENNLQDKTAGGIDMFKNLKEAKVFTAHLDALASEIESLEDVSAEMKTHLAFRLDKLSDMIEKSAAGAEKLFVHESVEGDADEKKYMKEFNTDLTEEVVKEAKVLEQDKDESFMKEFNTDMTKEVSNMKSPKADDGSENDALAIYVKKAMEKLK